MLASANTSRFLFDCPAAQQELRVVGFQAEQGVSVAGWCELELACRQSDLDVQTLVGKAGVLTLFDPVHSGFLHGEIVAASQGAVGKRFTTYHVTLRPKLWQLEWRHGLRIFQEQSVPDIVTRVLKDAGISGKDVRLELTGHYPPRVYCTQYRESDFAFINRLLAEEGLFYFFEHSIDRHVLVISDNKTSFKTAVGDAVIPYMPAAGMVTAQQCITEFQVEYQLCSGSVMVRDYFFEKPALQLEQQTNSSRFAMLQHYDYPAGFSDAGLGKQRARVQHEARQAGQQRIRGRSDSQRLACGRRFTLSQHPRKDFNADYSIVRTRLQGRQPQSLEEGASSEGSSFTLDFEAIPAGTAFRAQLLHPKPRVEGVQTAFVTGPKGEEIYTDQHGRIKVQFHWDRQGKHNERSSCWLRVTQAWAGNHWGSMVLPRIGQEVLVTFLDGDPDRPIVTGTLYNASTQPSYALPANKTRASFKSQSTPGGNGFNELRIEDRKGSEQLFLHAEKDANLFIKNDWKQSIDHDSHLIVEKDAFESVQKDGHLRIGANQNIKIGKTLSESVSADGHTKISNNQLKKIGREWHAKGGQTVVLEAGLSITLKAGNGTLVLDPMGVTIVGTKVRINSGGGGGSPKAAAPVAPKNPLGVDPGKPGDNIQFNLSNHQYEVSKIPFASGTGAKVKLGSTASAVNGKSAPNNKSASGTAGAVPNQAAASTMNVAGTEASARPIPAKSAASTSEVSKKAGSVPAMIPPSIADVTATMTAALANLKPAQVLDRPDALEDDEFNFSE